MTHDHAGLQWDTKLGSPSVWMDITLAPWSGPPRAWGSPPHPKKSDTEEVSCLIGHQPCEGVPRIVLATPP